MSKTSSAAISHTQTDFDVYLDLIFDYFPVCACLWQQMKLAADGLWVSGRVWYAARRIFRGTLFLAYHRKTTVISLTEQKLRPEIDGKRVTSPSF